MRKSVTILLALALACSACPKKDEGSSASTSSSSTKAKQDDNTKDDDDKKDDDQPKQAAPTKKAHPNKEKKKPADAKKTAVKDKKDGPVPKATDKKTDISASDDEMKHKEKADDAPKGACDGVADGTATCSGDNLFFCAGDDLYRVDCDVVAKGEGYTDGACFETDKEIDCLGCDVNTAGQLVCCDGDDKYCCDADGYCWTDATLTPPVDDSTSAPTPAPAPADQGPKYDPSAPVGSFACECDKAHTTADCHPFDWGDEKIGPCEKKYAPDCDKTLKCYASDGEYPP